MSPRQYRDWDAIVATCRATPGSWVVRLTDEPTRLARTIQDRSHPKLRLEEGVLEARVVNAYRDTLNRGRADIYIRYVKSDKLPKEVIP